MMRAVLAAALAVGLSLGPTLIPATAHAVGVCSEFGGTVEPDGLCRLREEKPNYSLSMSFPVDFPGQAALDDFLNQTRTGFLNESNTPSFANTRYEMDMKGSLWATGTTRSVSFEIYENLGGAHPNTWYKTFNHDTVRNRVLTFADLFAPGVDAMNPIFRVVQKKLEAEMGMPVPVSDSDGLDPSHYRNFAITPTDLVFFFDRGEMMAGAAGAHTVYVSRNAIPPLVV
jgi:hypothetical protein